MKRASDGGEGFGSAPKRYGKGGGSGVPRTRHAFKVLVADNLAAVLLGTRGAVKDEIQSETGTKLVFSNRNDYFPDSQYRVLGIYADDMSCINKAFEWILPKIIDLAEEERKNPPKEGPELLGKEPGEYVFRFTVTKRMSSAIIGTGGSHIKQIRSETGAKVFIENETKMDHQLCRVIGQPEQLLSCLERINGYVQEDCDVQDFFAVYANVVNFGDPEGSWAPVADASWSGGGNSGGAWKGKGGGGGGKGAAGASQGLEGRGVLVPPPNMAKGAGGEDREGLPLGSAQEEIEGLADVLSSFPPGTPTLQYAVACEVQSPLIGVLTDNACEYIKYVSEATATSIDFDGEEPIDPEAPRSMSIMGQLINCYTAHAMLLMKLRVAEAKEREEEQRRALEQSEDPQVLKARIQELQAQLAKVTGAA